MHILTFTAHIAVLDPGTGLGVLLLPDSSNGNMFQFCGQPAASMVERWFGHVSGEHGGVLATLSSIGWELPLNDHGVRAWFYLGCTDCCGRTMISLLGQDVTGNLALQTLLDAAAVIQTSATDACCVWESLPA